MSLSEREGGGGGGERGSTERGRGPREIVVVYCILDYHSMERRRQVGSNKCDTTSSALFCTRRGRNKIVLSSFSVPPPWKSRAPKRPRAIAFRRH
jgi:hypothetical protein